MDKPINWRLYGVRRVRTYNDDDDNNNGRHYATACTRCAVRTTLVMRTTDARELCDGFIIWRSRPSNPFARAIIVCVIACRSLRGGTINRRRTDRKRAFSSPEGPCRRNKCAEGRGWAVNGVGSGKDRRQIFFSRAGDDGRTLGVEIPVNYRTCTLFGLRGRGGEWSGQNRRSIWRMNGRIHWTIPIQKCKNKKKIELIGHLLRDTRYSTLCENKR